MVRGGRSFNHSGTPGREGAYELPTEATGLRASTFDRKGSRMKLARPLASSLFAATLACGATLAAAQTTRDGYSLLPYTKKGYVGVSLGRADYGLPCGPSAHPCDDKSKIAGKIYTGGMFNEMFGLEIGYIHMGAVERGGGKTHSQGVNASLVGRIPLNAFSVFAKVGATYGRTRIRSAPDSNLPGGDDSGLGASYGIGASLDMNPKSAIVLEWERHDFQMAGRGREPVQAISLGYLHRF